MRNKIILLFMAISLVVLLPISTSANHGDYFYYNDVIADELNIYEFGAYHFSYNIPLRTQRNMHDGHRLSLINCSLDWFEMSVERMRYSMDSIPFTSNISVTVGSWTTTTDYDETIGYVWVSTKYMPSIAIIETGNEVFIDIEILRSEQINYTVWGDYVPIDIRLKSNISFTSCYYEYLPTLGDCDFDVFPSDMFLNCVIYSLSAILVGICISYAINKYRIRKSSNFAKEESNK